MRVGRFAFAFGFFVELLIPFLLSGCEQETPYPRDPIHIVVPNNPGGVVDTSARLIQPYLQKYLGVPVVIDNMPGAGGNIGRAYVFRQPPDGYTLMVNLQPSTSAGQILTGARFDSLQFTHVYNITGHNYDAVAVPIGSPLKTIEDIRKASETHPLTTAGGGIGTTNYILAMLLKEKAGVHISFVPFNSGAETGLPQQKLSVLVAAMRKVFVDDQFLAAANQRGISLRPLEPVEFLKASSEAFSMVKEMERVLKP